MKQADIFSRNRKKLFSLLPDNSIAIFFSATPKIRSGDSEFAYCQDENFYYLTGYEYPGSTLIMSKLKSEEKAVLFVQSVSEKQSHWHGSRPDISDVQKATGVDNVVTHDRMIYLLHSKLVRSETCFFDYSPVSLGQPKGPVHQFIEQLKSGSPHIKIKRIFPFTAQLRQIKEKWEIDRIKSAIDITQKGILSILSHAKSGVLEYELEAYFNFELHRNGCCPAFQSIIASGANATTLHYLTNNSRIKKNDLVLIDLGAEYKHYSADISRTFPVSGKFLPKQKDLYEIVLKANEEVIQAVKSGISLAELNDIAKDIIRYGLKNLKIIKNDDEVDNYFTHHVSHMIGLTTHDVIKDPAATLSENMVITVEPGIYIPDSGIGIRIEDDVLVTRDGADNLSENIPKSTRSIEVLLQD